jgi:O-antigen/teichoic acid export membrane protein
MNPAGKAISLDRLKRRALSLGAVKTFDHAMRFVMPVLLVRCLDTASFGEYRLLWLVVGTVMLVATLNMCGGLYFWLPRFEPRRQRLYLHQTMLYLAIAGLAWGFLVSPWNPALPAPLRHLEPHGLLVPAFVALWVVGALMDFLPSVDERIRWQAYATWSVSALRALVVGLGAWLTGELRVVLWLLVAVVLFKVLLLLYYVRRWHGLGPPWFERVAFSAQFRHSAPIGLNNALSGLKRNADQWVVASLFAVSSFAAFSIAALVGQMMTIVRRSVMEAFLPSMSRLQATGDVRGMLDMNSRGNVMVGRLLYPLLAFVFVFAEELVTVVYTAAYVEAAPVMRVYIIGMLPLAVEIASLVLLLRRGKYALVVSGFILVLSVACSWIGAQQLGLPGAAAGSVLSVYINRVLMLRHVAQHTGIALRRLQDWRSLATALALAAVTAALAFVFVERFFSDGGPLVRLAAGGAVFALAYAATYVRFALSITRNKDAT